MENPLDGKALSAQALKTLVTDGTPAGHHLVYLPVGLGTPSSNRELANAVASLANAHGGLVVLGVETDGDRPRKLAGLGSGDPESDREEVRRTLTERIRPTVDAHVTVVRIAGGRHTLVIEVPPSLDAPHHVDGVYPQRSGRETVVMTAAEIDRVRAYRRSVLEGLRARALTLADAAQHNRIVRVKAGSVGLYLYVASVPHTLWGREVELASGDANLPGLQVLRGVVGEAIELRHTHYGALGTRLDARRESAEELAYISRRGELLHGLPDMRPFGGKVGDGFCVNVDGLQRNILDALPRNLVRLMDLGFAPPLYVALVGGGETTHVSFGDGARCGYPSNPKELVIEALLPLASLRTMSLPGNDEPSAGAYYEKLARPIRPLLDRLFQAAGLVSPWTRRFDESS